MEHFLFIPEYIRHIPSTRLLFKAANHFICIVVLVVECRRRLWDSNVVVLVVVGTSRRDVVVKVGVAPWGASWGWRSIFVVVTHGIVSKIGGLFLKLSHFFSNYKQSGQSTRKEFYMRWDQYYGWYTYMYIYFSSNSRKVNVNAWYSNPLLPSSNRA